MGELWVDHVSFSQLTAVEECPYQFFLLKMAGVESAENAFAQAGVLAHQLLAGWAKGEIPIKELPVQWVQRFTKEVTAEFPHFLATKGYKEKLFDAIYTYLEGFNGFPEYEIIGVEKEFNSMIAGERFVGIIDLLLREKATGKIVIVDFKSCSLASFKKSKERMYRQLLLYSKYCSDQYGSPPAKLRFELIKENTFDERSYDPEDYVAARLWAESVIEEMKSKDINAWFDTKPELFRCLNLCNCRKECPYGMPENHKRKENSDGAKRIHAVA